MSVGQLLSDPTSFWLLKAADFWVGAVGFLITAVTFFHGWYKLTKVQSEVKAVKSRIAHYDAIFESNGMAAKYQEMMGKLDEADVDWKMIASIMTSIKIDSVGIELTLKEADKVDLGEEVRKNSIKLEKIISGIENSVTGNGVLPDKAYVQKTIRSGREIVGKSLRVFKELVQ